MKYNVIYGTSSEKDEIDYELPNGIQQTMVEAFDEVICKQVNGSSSCFCDPITKYDILIGKEKTFGDLYWPDGPPSDLDENELDQYNQWSGFSRQWYAPLNWIDYTQSQYFTKEYTTADRYLLMFYHAVLIMTANELGPVNVIEMQFISMVIFLSFFIQAFLYGQIVDQMEVLGKQSNQMQSAIDGANQIIEYIQLDDEVAY